MSDVISRIVRRPNALTGLVTAGFGAAVYFGWITPDEKGLGIILALVGAVVLFIGEYVTPVSSPILEPGTIVNERSDKPTSMVVPLDKPA